MFGIGMGGEWGVGASLVMEKVSPRWRGVLSGLLQEGYAAGYLLAAGAAYVFLTPWGGNGTESSAHVIGWRPMLLLGGAPALLALFIRLFVKESEVWRKTKAESWSQLGRTICSHWKIWIYLTLLMAMMNFSSHGTQDLFPTFMEDYRKMETADYSRVVAIMMVGALVGGVVFGLASDRFGRRRMMIAAFVGALACVPLWSHAGQFGWIVVGAFSMQFMVQGAWGIVPAHISATSPPDAVRGFLPGFAYQCGNLIAASIAWMQASLAEKFPYPQVMAGTAVLIFSVAILAIVVGPERRGVVFGREGHRTE